ncbi:YiiX/YebB-like N1pC/P60 family cysteine hydrolase [Endothiovibrio diazotrophicus]
MSALLLGAALVAGYFYLIPFYWYLQYRPEAGDVVFQSLPKVDLVEAIEGASNSLYSHCGMIVRKADGWYVREAGPVVRDTPLYRWILQGRAARFSVFRLKADYRKQIPSFLAMSEQYLGLPYDYKYDLDDDFIYCSELVYKAYRDATGQPLGALVQLGSLNWRPYRETIEKYEGGDPPLERWMITPRHLSEATQLTKVFSNGI